MLFHLTIRLLTRVLLGYQRPNSVSTALLVSSCTKLFPILMVIWDYDVPAAARSVGWAVVVNNVEALKILLDCGYPTAAFLAASGAVMRLGVGWSILSMMGLDNGMRASSSVESLMGLLWNWEDWAARIGLG